MRKTTSDFVAELRAKNPLIEVIGEYENSKTKIAVQCVVCGNKWDALPGNLREGHGCPVCARAKAKKRARKSPQKFREELGAISPSIELLTDYESSKEKVFLRCLNCGNEWSAVPCSLLRGHGCPACAVAKNTKRQTMSRGQFIERLKAVNPSIAVVGEYRGVMETVDCECLVCGNKWSSTIGSSLLRGHGCPTCARTQTSFMERYLANAISMVVGEGGVICRSRKAIGRELDIFVPSALCAVEPGSWAWHKSSRQRKNDLEKRELCSNRGIRLITIYDSYPEENPPFETNCYVFPFDLASEPENKTLRLLASKILSDMGLSLEIDDEIHAALVNASRREARRKTPSDFEEEVRAILPTVKILTPYAAAVQPIKCECLSCGRIWETKPSYLLCGWGCRACGHKRGGLRNTLAQDEFESKLRGVNPSIKVIGTYTKSKEPISVKCAKCGYTWTPVAHSLLAGRGCPRCAGKERKTTARFVEEMADCQPKIEVLGEYVTSKAKIAVRCRDCGRSWESTPNQLLRKRSRCPICKS